MCVGFVNPALRAGLLPVVASRLGGDWLDYGTAEAVPLRKLLQPSLRDSRASVAFTQHFVLGYCQSSLRDRVGVIWCAERRREKGTPALSG